LDVGDSAPQKYDLHVLVHVDLLYAQIFFSKNGGPQKWILLARQNLVTEYEALHQPEEAAKFRAASAKP
jgi:hypothetical protein